MENLDIFDIFDSEMFNEEETDDKVEKTEEIEEEKVETVEEETDDKEEEVEKEKTENESKEEAVEEEDTEEESEEVADKTDTKEDIEEENEEEEANEEVEEEETDEEEEETSEEVVEVKSEEIKFEDDNEEKDPISRDLDPHDITYEKLDSYYMDDLKVFMDNNHIEYNSRDRKDDLISKILEFFGIEETKEEKSIPEMAKEIKEKSNRVSQGAKTKVPIQVEDEITVEMPLTDVHYDKAVEMLQPSFVDPDWNNYKLDIDRRLGEIKIEEDMTPSRLKQVLSELSDLRQEVWLPYQKAKTLYEMLGSKEPEGLIERVKRIAYNPNDRNDMERRRTGIKACLEYTPPEMTTSLNLYEILDETRERYNFLHSVMNSIRYKTNSLITVNGALKLEKHHIINE